jgi:hypothetical protein
MEKQRKPLSTKKPPIPSHDYIVIEEWMANRIMPGIQPLIKEINALINDLIPNLHYAIKWGNAYYGTKELGWLIEIAAYDVSANIVFLGGAAFDPQPPLGTDEQTRYIKLRTMDELQDQKIVDYIRQAGQISGWK